MSNNSIFSNYEKLYKSLQDIISESETRVLSDEPDFLFIENTNFFVKSYLISMCTYLESYLQDIAYEYVKFINLRVKIAAIPKNLALWRASKEVKDRDLRFEDLDLSVSKKEISDNLSGNPHKTIKLFQYLGIKLEGEENFEEYRSLINSIVIKRNNIIHHNDNAMDISFLDLYNYINSFIIYMKSIETAIENQKIKPINSNDYS